MKAKIDKGEIEVIDVDNSPRKSPIKVTEVAKNNNDASGDKLNNPSILRSLKISHNRSMNRSGS